MCCFNSLLAIHGSNTANVATLLCTDWPAKGPSFNGLHLSSQEFIISLKYIFYFYVKKHKVHIKTAHMVLIKIKKTVENTITNKLMKKVDFSF